jgi:hypothetical protein
MRRLLVLSLMLAGCGVREGQEAKLEAPPIVGKAFVIDKTTVYADADAIADTDRLRSRPLNDPERQAVLERAFVVDNGTRVRILKIEGEQATVRILEGPKEGETGWVRSKHLK